MSAIFWQNLLCGLGKMVECQNKYCICKSILNPYILGMIFNHISISLKYYSETEFSTPKDQLAPEELRVGPNCDGQHTEPDVGVALHPHSRLQEQLRVHLLQHGGRPGHVSDHILNIASLLDP